MKASEVSFVKFLQGTKQFVIPIYQRTYSWSIRECEQLWEDIERVAEDDSIGGHFVGSIVYIESGLYHVASVSKLLVIDGQQRLTTLTLILTALVNANKSDSSVESTRKIFNRYLSNSDETGEDKYRLLLTKTDKETLISIVEGHDLPKNYSKRIVQNYEYFLDTIKKSNIDSEKIHDAISRLIVVDVALDRERDNPQLIFESLNSTGVDLSQADLIRNYVLMGLEPKHQEELYNQVWYPMEQSFGDYEYSKLFDRFIRDYLTIKTGRIPKIDQVYVAFKEYVIELKDTDIDSIIKDVYDYSKIFTDLTYNKFPQKNIRSAVDDINALRVDVTYPFLLEVFKDYQEGLLDEDGVVKILRLVESYVFRRAICGVPTNSLNSTFASLAKGINKNEYIESLEAILRVKEGALRMPNNEEFKSQLAIKDIYNFRNRSYFLRKIENFDRKETVDVDTYTIEHIMPQNKNLSSDWQHELGVDSQEVQQKYLHTVGNLTLTGYNSELSDKPFIEKRDMDGGFADSPIRMNRHLGKLDHWNENEIVLRAKDIAKTATKIWSLPEVDDSLLEKYKPKDIVSSSSGYTLELHEKEVDTELWRLFINLRKRIINLSSDIVEFTDAKSYIRYAMNESIAFVRFQKGHMSIEIRISIDEVSDPKGICEKWGESGGGNVRVFLKNDDGIEDVMNIVEQSYDKDSNNE